MNKATINVNNLEFSFTDADVCNLFDWIPAGESNPHNVRPWLLHDHGFTLAVVFAGCLQDAIDEAVDNGKLTRFKLDEKEVEAYCDTDNEELISYLGNYGVPHDIESLDYIEIVNPPASFTAQFNACEWSSPFVGIATETASAGEDSLHPILDRCTCHNVERSACPSSDRRV